MFINIRGPMGSGKSTIMMGVVKHLRSKYLEESIKVPQPKNPEVYSHIAHRFNNIVVIGRYVSFSGGADTISWKGSQEQITQFIRDTLTDSHVLLEGAIVSGCPRYVNLGKELSDNGHKCLYYYLTVPFNQCIERIHKRREDTAIRKNRKMVVKPLNMYSLEKEYIKVKKQIRLANDFGLPVRYIDSDLNPDQVSNSILHILGEKCL